MKRALIVSYYFPPRFSIGGKRAYRFARYLPERGWQTTVLTAQPPPDERLDPSFSDQDLPSCDVRRDYLSPAELARMPRRTLGSDGTIEAPTEGWSRVSERKGFARLRAELRYVSVIGPDTRLIPAFAARIARLARSSGAHVIFASGAPWEAVIAGILAGKILSLPVVADFRDPWSFGPSMATRPTWARAAARLAESAALRGAAALTVTTETTRDEYARMYPWARVECVRTGFDAEMRVEPRRDQAVTLVHFGNCYGERSLAPFLRALAAVVRRRALAPGSIRLLNLGRVARGDLDLASALGVAPFFEHRTVLPYAEGIGLVAGADLALLPGFGVEPWFLPGKLYDYLLARVPVLAASTSPELGRILETTRLGWACSTDDIEAITGHIDAAVTARAAGQRLVDPDPDAIEALSARASAGELADLFDHVTART